MTEQQREWFNPSGPIEGENRALAITTAASAEQTLEEFVGEMIEFAADVPFYLTVGPTPVTDPDGAATSGAGRTKRIEAGELFKVRVVDGVNDRFKARGVGAGTLRWNKYNG
jgi:hypothetical protein